MKDVLCLDEITWILERGALSLDWIGLDLDLMFYLYSNIQTHKGIYHISETEGFGSHFSMMAT